jgi:hypothetical protein
MPWRPHNLTEHADATSANGPPVSHVVTAERTQHVFHRGLGLGEGPQVLVELWWRPGEKPQWGVLGAGSGADMSVFGGWLASHVVESDGTQHVFVDDGTDVHPYELWWRGPGPDRAGDLSKLVGQPALSGGPLASHVFVAQGTQHVFTTVSGDIDGVPVGGHVCEFLWGGSEPVQVVDLTMRAAGAPTPNSGTQLASHVVEGPFTAERSQHVFYLAGREIFELRWGADKVTTFRGLIGSASGERGAAAHAPATHVDPDGTQHLFYAATDGHLFELTWKGDQDPVGRELTAHSTGVGPAPNALTGPASHLFLAEGTHHIYYVSNEQHIIEMWWYPGEDPHHEDLTVQTGAPLAFPDRPVSHVFVDIANQQSTQHVFYTSIYALIIELWWQA